MGQFAASTSVSAERSRAEIEQILLRYGASRFAYAAESAQSMIAFEANNRRIRFIVPMPDWESYRTFKRRSDSPKMSTRTDAQIGPIFNQDVRQRWRAFLLAVKAKLEAVESGISTFEDEFLAYTVLPNGKTMSEWVQPQIGQAYADGKMPRALLT